MIPILIGPSKFTGVDVIEFCALMFLIGFPIVLSVHSVIAFVHSFMSDVQNKNKEE